MTDIIKLIKQEMAAKDVISKELADYLNISQARLSYYLHGERSMPLDYAIKALKLFGYNLEVSADEEERLPDEIPV